MKLRVKEVCKEKGILFKDLAEKVGVTDIGLRKSIQGNPTLESLEKIAKALEVDITELFTVANEELYGVIIYKGKHYKIDSLNGLKALINEIEG